MGELIVNGIKWAFMITVSITFGVAIGNIILLIIDVVETSIVGEIFGVISCCLPFDASAVFGGLFGIFGAILTFMTARKIYSLISGWVQV